MSLQVVVQWTVAGCLAYLACVFMAFVLMIVGSVLQHRLLTREEDAEDYAALAGSRFTIPVSVLVPAYNEAPIIQASVESLLSLDYPEFEVIVVNDGSIDGTLEELIQVFQLERREVFYRRLIDSHPLRGIYRSRTHPNLVVADKVNKGKADALNAGLNLARYRYVCTVDADTVYEPSSLLHSMRDPVRDPAAVVGITSSVTITGQPENGHRNRIDYLALTNFQRLDYLRAFLNNRIGWARWNFMLCAIGAFAIWRRDVVVQLGGFSADFTCEDIEFTFRVHEHFRRQKQVFRIGALQESVGHTEGPDTIRGLVSQRARWQRVISETVWHYKRMCLNPRYGSVGMIGMPYYVLVEALAPIFQTASVLVVPLVWWVGLASISEILLCVLTTALINATLTNVAILINDRSRNKYPLGDTVRLMLLGVGDMFVYRPILFYAQAKGLVDFLAGKKGWHKVERNYRQRPIHGGHLHRPPAAGPHPQRPVGGVH